MDITTIVLSALLIVLATLAIAVLPWRDNQLEETVQAGRSLITVIRRWFG